MKSLDAQDTILDTKSWTEHLFLSNLPNQDLNHLSEQIGSGSLNKRPQMKVQGQACSEPNQDRPNGKYTNGQTTKELAQVYAVQPRLIPIFGSVLETGPTSRIVPGLVTKTDRSPFHQNPTTNIMRFRSMGKHSIIFHLPQQILSPLPWIRPALEHLRPLET